jgi:hypothetical protein
LERGFSLSLSAKRTPVRGVLLSAACASLLCVATEPLVGQSTWVTTGGSADQEQGAASEATRDGGYISVGTRVSVGTGKSSIVLSRVRDDVGIWTRQIDTTNGNDTGHALRNTSDGGHILVGTTTANGPANAMLLIKTDSNGATTWARTYASTVITGQFMSVSEAPGGGYIVSGFRDNGPGFARAGVLVRVSSTGVLLWSKTYTDAAMGANSRTVFNEVQVSEPGFIVVGTNRMLGTTFERNLLVRVDASGAVIWSRAYGDNNVGHDKGAVASLANSGYAFTSGYTRGGAVGTCVTLTDSLGALNGSCSEFPGTGYYAPSIREDYYRELLVTTGNFGIVKLFGNGTFRFGRRYLQGSQSFIADAIPTQQGGIAMTGFTNGFSQGLFDGLGVKADYLGQAGCQTASQASPVYSTPLVLPVTMATANNPGSAVVFVTNTMISLPVQTLCYTQGCAKPPSAMVLWLPFDEAVGPTAKNLSGGNNGTHANAPMVGPGTVGNCISLDGTNRYVEVPGYPNLGIGSRDFTVDAWIKPTSGSGIIADHRQQGPFKGWSFYLQSGGRLSLQIANGAPGSGFTNYESATSVSLNVWHHVAVTVDRDSATGLIFYLDGVQAGVFNPTGRQGSLTPASSPLRVGNSAITTNNFAGCIDEVEVFSRALSAAEIRSLFLAGSYGKCKERTFALATKTFCFNEASKTVNFKIDNRTAIAQTYDVFVHGLPIGALSGCTATGPTQFSWSPQVTIPAFQSLVVPITIARPNSMLVNTTGGYEVLAQNITPGYALRGNAFSQRGKIILSPNFCFGVTGDSISVPSSGPALIPPFPVTNLGPAPASLNYRIGVRNGEFELDAQSVSLNGLPPGTPITGLLTLGSNQTGNIPSLQVAFLEDRQEEEFSLVIEADLDGDTVLEQLTSVQLVHGVPSNLGTVIPYGTACSNATIGSLGTPQIGSSVAVQLASAPANILSGLVIGFSSASVPLSVLWPSVPPGCSLLATPDIIEVAISSASGSATLPISLPPNPSLVGLHLYCQWLMLDAASSLSATAGADIGIGG